MLQRSVELLHSLITWCSFQFNVFSFRGSKKKPFNWIQMVTWLILDEELNWTDESISFSSRKEVFKRTSRFWGKGVWKITNLLSKILFENCKLGRGWFGTMSHLFSHKIVKLFWNIAKKLVFTQSVIIIYLRKLTLIRQEYGHRRLYCSISHLLSL